MCDVWRLLMLYLKQEVEPSEIACLSVIVSQSVALRLCLTHWLVNSSCSSIMLFDAFQMWCCSRLCICKCGDVGPEAGRPSGSSGHRVRQFVQTSQSMPSFDSCVLRFLCRQVFSFFRPRTASMFIVNSNKDNFKWPFIRLVLVMHWLFVTEEDLCIDCEVCSKGAHPRFGVLC